MRFVGMPAANSLASNKIMQIQRVKWSDIEYLSVQFLIQTSFNIQFKQFSKFNSFALYILNFQYLHFLHLTAFAN